MKNLVLIILCLFYAVVLPGQTNENIKFNRHHFNVEITLPKYIGTDSPINSTLTLGAGYEFYLTERFSVGLSCSYSKWQDALGLYGGFYTFKIIRPVLNFTYYLLNTGPSQIVPFCFLGFSYHFADVTNQLNNRYDGEIDNQLSLLPGVGIKYSPFQLKSGQKLVVSLKLSYQLDGPFSGLYGHLGLGIGF